MAATFEMTQPETSPEKVNRIRVIAGADFGRVEARTASVGDAYRARRLGRWRRDYCFEVF